MNLAGWGSALAGLFGLVVGAYKIFFSRGARTRKIQKQLYNIRVKQRKARAKNDETEYQRLEVERDKLLEKVKLL